MTVGLFIAWVLVLATVIASYVWLAIATVRANSVPHRWKWSVLVPPVACWIAFRSGGWPRAAALVFVLSSGSYGLLRVLA